MSERYVLGGHAYNPVGVFTAEHDAYMMGRVRRAGLDQLVMESGEDTEVFARRFFGEMMASGEAFNLLGGLLVPEGAKWTPEVARETATLCAGLTEDEDKAQLWEMFATLVVRFFAKGREYLTVFVRS